MRLPWSFLSPRLKSFIFLRPYLHQSLFVVLCWTCSSMAQLRAQQWCASSMCFINAEQRGKITFINIAAVLFPLQPNLPVYRSLPGFLSPANFLMLCSVPFYRSLMKTLNSVGHGVSPCGTELVTGCQLDFMLLIVTLWAQQFSQFSVSFTVHFSSPCFISLSMRM